MKHKKQARITSLLSLRVHDACGDIYVPECVDDVVMFTERYRTFHVLGGGSNVIAGSLTEPVLIMGKYESSTETEQISDSAVRVQAPAGLPVSLLLAHSRENGLSGIEFMAGIPGTVGGAVAGNAAPRGESWESVVRELIVAENGRVYRLTPEYSYRSLDNAPTGNFVILAVELELALSTSEEVAGRISLFRNSRLTIPWPSAGSLFRNPSAGSAGKLIDDAGLKGTTTGEAALFEGHANIVINKGSATFGDFIALRERVKQKVREVHGITLETEVRFWKE